MNNTTKIIIIAVIALGLGFFGGMKYGQGTATAVMTANRAAAFAGRGGVRSGAAGASFTTGQILSADAQSITVSLPTGGSKIIFLSSSTTIMKVTTGAPTDLVVGANVTATGSANSDGSITAQSIQIRPVGSPARGQ